MNEFTSYNVDWDKDLNYKGMSKIQIKGEEFIKLVEESLMLDLPSTTPMTREESLDEDIRILKSNDLFLTGWPKVYNLHQLIMCLMDKIKKDHC